MQKVLLILACVFIITLIAITIVFTSKPVDVSQSFQQDNLSQTPTPTATISRIATPTPSPLLTPNPTPKASSLATVEPLSASFGPLGGFRIVPPSNTSYNTSCLNLTISGQAIAVGLSMSYCIDGQERVSIPAQVKQVHDWDPFFGGIHESVVLPPLANGYHSIVVYGRQLVHDCKEAQTSVYFTIE